MKILSISHYDLDGFGCQLCIYEKFKNYNIVFDNCGYNKINKTLDKYDFNNFDLVFITDLNFTIKNQELLYDKLLDYKGKCIYIDHHQYDTTEILDKSNCKVIIDDTKSATLKTYEVLKLNNSNLLKLCKVIDIYDMWRTKNKHFQKASLFNDYFWETHKTFREDMIKNNYIINVNFKELEDKVDDYFKEELNKTIFCGDDMVISFDYKYSNHFCNLYCNNNPKKVDKGIKTANIIIFNISS